MAKLKEYKFHYNNKEIGVILAYNRNEAYVKAEMIANKFSDGKTFGIKVVEKIL